MRIVAGDFKGRVVKAPPAEITRPTTDRVREALMSSLYSLLGDFEGLNVLDAFAGSGALGIECISRGAGHVTFFEKNPKAFKVLQENIAMFPNARRQITLRKIDVLKNPPTAGKPFDLVFLDPPYAFEPEVVADFLAGLDKNGMLSDDAIIYYEHAKSLDLGKCDCFDKLQLSNIVSKSYGDIAFDMFEREQR